MVEFGLRLIRVSLRNFHALVILHILLCANLATPTLLLFC